MVTHYFMNRHVHLLAVLGVVAALLLVGCGGSSSGPASSPSPTAASTSTSTSATTTTNATATLKHQPQGMATISWDPTNQGLTVKISLTGLAPNSKHPAHIHSGSCAKQGGVVYPLTDVVADGHGVGTSTTTIKSVANLSPTGWYLNIHNGPNLTPSDQFLPIACTDLTFSNVSPASQVSVQVPLNAAPGSSEDQSASGMAQLTLSSGTLTVKLTLSGLAPNSKHAVHIHSGSCESQGGVVYTIPPVAADASGNASETATFPNVSSIPSSGWYVNVHHSTDLSTQTGFDPIACGNVIVG